MGWSNSFMVEIFSIDKVQSPEELNPKELKVK
jgi:hypothetical protein